MKLTEHDTHAWMPATRDLPVPDAVRAVLEGQEAAASNLQNPPPAFTHPGHGQSEDAFRAKEARNETRVWA